MEATLVRSSISPLASSYINRTFSGLKLQPERIMRMLGECETSSSSFLSRFLSPLGRTVPEIRLSYITSKETDRSSRNSFGYAIGTDVSLILDNILRNALHYVYPLDILVANHYVHEFVHASDAAHTRLMDSYQEIRRSRLSRRMVLMGRPLLEKMLIRRDPQFESLSQLLFGIDTVIEGRATRASYAFMSEMLGKGPYSQADAMMYLRHNAEWYLDCMLFMEKVERAFGFRSAWKITESILPISSAEIYKPELYLSRVRELGNIIRNSNQVLD